MVIKNSKNIAKISRIWLNLNEERISFTSKFNRTITIASPYDHSYRQGKNSRESCPSKCKQHDLKKVIIQF